MKETNFTTAPAYIYQYLYAGVFAIVVFVLSLIGEIWFIAGSGVAEDLLNGTAPMWVHNIIALIAVLLFASLWLATKAFSKAGKETWSMIVFIGGMIILLVVGQLWHLAM